MNLWAIFITGLTTGALTCLAVQGGLLASVIAGQKQKELEETEAPARGISRFIKRQDWMSVGLFLVAKLGSHMVVGFLLGALGSVITLSLGMRVTFQIIAALFMIAAAMNLLNVHPIFRYIMFQPPRFMQRWVRNSARGQSFFTPIMVGALTIFVPCGVTQAMEVLAITSGNPVQGALILGVFVLGTVPLFGGIGLITAKLGELWRGAFLKVTAVALLLMALYSINGALVVLDVPFSAQRLAAAFAKQSTNESSDVNTNIKTNSNSNSNTKAWQSSKSQDSAQQDSVQKVTINVQNSGYNPKKFQVKAGTPVELTVKTNGVYSCAAAFTFRAFNINEILEPTDSQTFRFTPTKPGKYTYSCSMGMYSGVMEVI
ncbi:MAG: sulfite exporter TauE/SafE family protein [Candidatus Kerfeldbacteria bacterium]|nr:sulfite exporter TauE/SafE family protein [Candidatus Kerfeldbacteria bacterium]